MKYDIIFSPGTADDFRCLKARDRSIIRDAIEQQLRHEPQKLSKSRIKKLRKISHPQYRLRLGEFRIFYDVAVSTVEVLAIIPKSQATEWLGKEGEKE